MLSRYCCWFDVGCWCASNSASIWQAVGQTRFNYCIRDEDVILTFGSVLSIKETVLVILSIANVDSLVHSETVYNMTFGEVSSIAIEASFWFSTGEPTNSPPNASTTFFVGHWYLLL